MEYILSKRKTLSEEMGYQPGKLYKIADAWNRTERDNWLCWLSPSPSIFEPACGIVSEGDMVVFLAEEKGYFKLLAKDGTTIYVRTGTTKNKTSLILVPVSNIE